MGVMEYQITGHSTVCLTAYADPHQRNIKVRITGLIVRGIHRWPVISPYKGPVTRQKHPSMTSSCSGLKMLTFLAMRLVLFMTTQIAEFARKHVFPRLSVAMQFPDSNVHGANMGPTWVLSAPDGPHVGPMNPATRVTMGKPPAL